MKKKILLLALTAALLAACITGWTFYQRHQYTALLAPILKNTSIRLGNSLRAGSSITFKEFFERGETDLREIESHVISAQSTATKSNSQISSPAVEYLQNSQELLRALLQQTRGLLEFTSSLERMAEAVNEVDTSDSAYGRKLAIERANKATAQGKKAKAEIESALVNLVTVAKKLKKSRVAAAAVFEDDVLIPLKIVDELIARTEKQHAGLTTYK